VGHIGQMWTSTSHDCKGGCICTETNEPAWRRTVTVSPECPLTGHSGGVTSVSFSADGKRIVSGSSDSLIKIWDVKTGAEVSSIV